MDMCYVSVSRRTVIDFVRNDGRTRMGGHTLDEVRERYPDAALMMFADAKAAIENALIDREPTKLSAADFIEALEVLPPKTWLVRRDTESFKMREHLYGSVTRIYARLNNEYFTFNDRCTLTHDEIVAKCRGFSQLDGDTKHDQLG